jgi:hypothetical protein
VRDYPAGPGTGEEAYPADSGVGEAARLADPGARRDDDLTDPIGHAVDAPIGVEDLADPESSGESLLLRSSAAEMRTLTSREEESASSFPIRESVIRGGFDYSGVDVPSSLSLASFRGLRK